MIKEITKNLFSTVNRIPYAEIEGARRTEIFPVYSEEVKHAVAKFIFGKTGNPPSKGEADRIQDLMAAEALYKGDKKTVWVRSAIIPDGIEIDLNNEAGQCIRISKDGWSITAPESCFYRPSSSREMIVPQTGGAWELFKKHFKTKNEEDLKLLIGFALSSLHATGPYATLVLQGEQGSAKSTTAQMLKALVDPSMGATRGFPKKEQDLFIAAKNNHLISFDNLSVVSNELSDSLCRLATGGSFSARTLYTNDSETLIELCKPVLLNGITDFVTRADLASRSIIVELASIPEKERKPLSEVMAAFTADLPYMLGVLMDGMVSALKNKEITRLEDMPRMADMALWCTAAEEGLKWPQYSFMEAFESNQMNAVLNNLSTDPVAIALRSFLASWESGRWTGSAAVLLSELEKNRPYSYSSRSWPATPAYLSQYLSRMAPNLRKVGINFVGKDRSSKQRVLILEKLPNFMEMHSPKEAGAWNSEVMNSQMFDNGKEWFRPDDANDGNDANF